MIPVRTLTATLLCALPGIGLAADTVLGIVISQGKFLLNNHPLNSQASLIAEDRIEAKKASLRILVGSGIRIVFAPGAVGSIRNDRLVLESGNAEFTSWNGDAFALQAGGIALTLAGPHARARVNAKDARTAGVAVVTGAATVKTTTGIPVSNMTAGQSLQFSGVDTGGASTWILSGCIVRAGGAFMIQDETTGLQIQLRGTNLAGFQGAHVEVKGRSMETEKSKRNLPEVEATTVTRKPGSCIQ